MSIFEKYGGQGFWEDFVHLFLSRLLEDPHFQPFFQGGDITHMETGFTNILDLTLGTAKGHFSTSIRKVHQRLDIQEADFDQFVQVFSTVIEEKGVRGEDGATVLNVLQAFKDDVLRRHRKQ